MIKANITLKENVGEVERKILRAMSRNINKVFAAKRAEIRDITEELLSEELVRSPEFERITNGTLRFELGLIDAETKLINIIDELMANIDVDFKLARPAGSGFTGGLTIKAVRADYSDVLTMPEAITITEKGVDLHWLRWLLLEGGDIIVAGYDVLFGEGLGRTKGAIMIQGGGWSIPPQDQGKAGDNFITRAIERIQVPLREKVKECLISA